MTPAEAGTDRDPATDPELRPVPAAPGWGSACLAAALAGALLALVALNHLTPRATEPAAAAPPRPAGVPAEALFCGGPDGGHFLSLQRDDLRLADGRQLPAFRFGA